MLSDEQIDTIRKSLPDLHAAFDALAMAAEKE